MPAVARREVKLAGQKPVTYAADRGALELYIVLMNTYACLMQLFNTEMIVRHKGFAGFNRMAALF